MGGWNDGSRGKVATTYSKSPTALKIYVHWSRSSRGKCHSIGCLSPPLLAMSEVAVDHRTSAIRGSNETCGRSWKDVGKSTRLKGLRCPLSVCFSGATRDTDISERYRRLTEGFPLFYF
jgi:hypothetical protein